MNSRDDQPKESWMPSVTGEALRASARQLPGGQYGRAGLNVILWLYLGVRLTLSKADTSLMRWGFLGFWLVSGLILVARWRWQRQHQEEYIQKRSWLDFQFQWKYAGFMVTWTGLLLGLDSLSSDWKWSLLRLVLTMWLIGGLIWLIFLVFQRRTQGP